MFDAGIHVSRFLLLEVPDDILVARGCGRRLDPETGEIYHLTFRPPPEDIVARLVQRSDDQEISLRRRLCTYHEEINRIAAVFGDVVTRIDGTGPAEMVSELVFAALG